MEGTRHQKPRQAWKRGTPWSVGRRNVRPANIGVVAGRRYYSPGIGRWASRDPIGEREGARLVLFAGNSPADHFDPLGLYATDLLDWSNRDLRVALTELWQTATRVLEGAWAEPALCYCAKAATESCQCPDGRPVECNCQRRREGAVAIFTDHRWRSRTAPQAELALWARVSTVILAHERRHAVEGDAMAGELNRTFTARAISCTEADARRIAAAYLEYQVTAIVARYDARRWRMEEADRPAKIAECEAINAFFGDRVFDCSQVR